MGLPPAAAVNLHIETPDECSTRHKKLPGAIFHVSPKGLEHGCSR